MWAIRTHLQLAGKARDLALFNVALDSKLRGCDVVALRVVDVAPHGCALDCATVRQSKTGRPVTREALDGYLKGSAAKNGGFLFPGRRGRHLATR